MKTLSAVVCFALLGVMPIALKFDQQEENQKMNRTETAVKFIKSDTLPPSPGYSQAVTVRSGRLVYVAGQVAMDPSGKLVGLGDFRAQTEQTFENLKAALAASGAAPLPAPPSPIPMLHAQPIRRAICVPNREPPGPRAFLA